MLSSSSIIPGKVEVEFDKLESSAPDLDLAALIKASDIGKILEKYTLARSDSSTEPRIPSHFIWQLYEKVRANVSIHMCLPAFPFKSPNTTDKVLGKLPDKAEEFALCHLDGLCKAIGDIYEPGAQLLLVSDGIVYNDLLGVADKDVWAYGQALRDMVVTMNLKNLHFSRLRDLVSIDLDADLDEITYVANATNFRRALLNTFGRSDYDPSVEIRDNMDTCLTYRGYIKFLQTDLRITYPTCDGRSKSKYKSGVEYIAKQMLRRGDAFARAVRDKYESHIRLSIHPSSCGKKIPISTLPTTSSFTTPWHCCIGYDLDGTVVTALRSEFDSNDKYELVSQDGQPMFFRERSTLYEWPHDIRIEPMYPCGLMITPGNGMSKPGIDAIMADRVRSLAVCNSPVVLRGFVKKLDQDAFIHKAEEFGKPQPWKFGLVLSVKDVGSDVNGLNNVQSSEWMPFHFDGLFKTKQERSSDGTQRTTPNPPRFQLFVAVTPSPADTGFTLFAPSRLVLNELSRSLPSVQLSDLTWTVSTPSFGATTMTRIPLIETHPDTGLPCLRYHESWPQHKTKFEPTMVQIDHTTRNEDIRIRKAIDEALHGRHNCYWHSWKTGDMLVSDNVSTMHTRSDFAGHASRELWRIHFD
ncbi:hypothetical protein CAC42_5544 [Sphaceloma murrayae]|uniref:TauD/TfdA-like domain-containing protein n=1 Tax=Sphaceloma murrayae TaxID=2082308 RepID=A0A2K1QYG3_9PEZI|nr:hypothetical protein CAC42_5544 [Sphaceloma murrayae]